MHAVGSLIAGSLLAETLTEETSSSAGPVIGALVVSVVVLIAGWKVLAKAALPGWGVLIPVYNTYLLCKAARKPGWWFLLMLIPLVNIVVGILVMSGLSKAFGKGTGFTVGLVLLHPIFLMILGFGSARYQAPTPA